MKLNPDNEDCLNCINTLHKDHLFEVKSYGLTGDEWFIDLKCIQYADEERGCTKSYPIRKTQLERFLTEEEYANLEY